MRSWIGTQRLLLVFLACTGATSCQQRNAQTASRNSEGGFSREHTEAEGATLSEEQIIAIADRVAWDRGFWPQLRYGYERRETRYAKKSLGGPVVPQLVGHNYHVIAYRNPRGALDGGLSVCGRQGYRCGSHGGWGVFRGNFDGQPSNYKLAAQGCGGDIRDRRGKSGSHLHIAHSDWRSGMIAKEGGLRGSALKLTTRAFTSYAIYIYLIRFCRDQRRESPRCQVLCSGLYLRCLIVSSSVTVRAWEKSIPLVVSSLIGLPCASR